MFSELGRLSRALDREEFLEERNLKIRTLEENEEIEENEIYYDGNAIEIPPDIFAPSVIIRDGLSNASLALIIDSIQNPEGKFIENNPSDDYMHQYEKDLQVGLRSTADFRKSNPSGSQVFRVDGRRIYPDGWELAYYPAGKKGKRGKIEQGKPNIDAIALWVRDVKLAGKSQLSLEDEYKRIFQVETVNGWSEDKEDSLVRSIAYLVARKIWYVGRKSSRETDEQWQETTKDMRPAQGSFSKDEKWNNGFPYGREYVYSSGEQ